MTQCRFTSVTLALLCSLSGCAVSPIPYNIGALHKKAQADHSQLQSILQPGDLVFRKGSTRVLGIIDFSSCIQRWTDSRFSHVALVIENDEDDAVLFEANAPDGARAVFLRTWLLGSQNIVVKRLKPHLAHRLPLVIAEARELIRRDPLFDKRFAPGSDALYCSEAVHICFVEAGVRLADTVAIQDLPGLRPWSWLRPIVLWTLGIDMTSHVAVPGLMAKSPLLDEVKRVQ